jgi:hypothetical protein
MEQMKMTGLGIQNLRQAEVGRYYPNMVYTEVSTMVYVALAVKRGSRIGCVCLAGCACRKAMVRIVFGAFLG